MQAARRRFIRTLGSAAVIVAAPALPACAPVPEEAIEAWRLAGADPDLRRKLVSYAILAPNPHNRQPWLVDLRRDGEITLHCDLERLLPMTDPYGRQILIGHGCFLELLALAASAQGQQAEIALFPEGEPAMDRLDARPVARVRLAPGTAARDPLFGQILARGTYKQAFAAKVVPAGSLKALAEAASRPSVTAGSTQDPATVAKLNDILVRAWDIEQDTPRTWKESVDLTRVGAHEIRRHRDGISLGGTLMEVLRLLGQMTPEKAMDRDSAYFSGGKQRVREWVPTTSSWLWLTTSAQGRAAQIEAGRAFARMQLKAAELGLVTQPPSQVLQEYPEMRELQREFEALVGQKPGEKVQMLVRVGVPDAAPVRSPRRPLAGFARS
jgi:nitroreductase